MENHDIEASEPAQGQAEKEIDIISLEDFLVGPDRTYGELVIDDIFAKEFDDIRKDALEDNPDAFSPIGNPILMESESAAGYSVQEVQGGMALYSPSGELAGGYIGCDITIEPEHRGKGLGAELVKAYYQANNSLPTWDLDDAAYSRAGLRCHENAWHLLNNEIDAKATSEQGQKQKTCRP